MKGVIGKIIKGIIAFIAVVVIILFVYNLVFPANEYYKNNERWRLSFGPITYETLRGPLIEEQNEEEQEIYNLIIEALTSTDDNMDEVEFPYNDLMFGYGKISNVEYKVVPIRFTKIFDKGYYWFEFSVLRYNDKGEIINGSANILSCVKVKYRNGKMIATKVIQTP